MNEDRRKLIEALLSAGAAISALGATSTLASCANLLKNTDRSPNSINNFIFTALKTDRIAIIGAGAAGISAAYYLREKGYTNVVVFEERSRIGGKCNSVHIDGQVYDMGAVFTTSSYTEVIALAEKFNVDLGLLQGQDAAVILDSETAKFHTSSTIAKAALLGVAAQYLQKIKTRPFQNIFNPGFRYLDLSLMVPFSEWLQKNSISPKTLESFFGYTFTPFGYGYTNEVPAAYAIKYYESKLVTSLIQQSSNLRMVTAGYQTLWEKVAKNMDIRLNSAVEKITRDRDREMVSIQIKNTSITEDFKFLINTSPLDTSLKFLDATKTEKNIFSQIKNYYYYTFAIETPQNFPSTGFLPANYSHARQHHPLCWLKRWEKHNIAIFYVLSDSPNDTELIQKTIYSDLNQKNYQLGKIRETKCWKYFPHFETANLQRNVYDALEGIQGENQTLIAGEIMNFSTVELTTRYSKNLIERFF